jgi:hypothetical protein
MRRGKALGQPPNVHHGAAFPPSARGAPWNVIKINAKGLIAGEKPSTSSLEGF